MKKIMIAASSLLLLMASGQAWAEEGKFSLGVGTYALSLTPSSGSSLSFAGGALVGNYDFTDVISVGGHFYSIDATEFAPVTGVGTVEFAYANSGYDAILKAGKNGLGFVYFGGLGFYSETIELSAPAFPSAGTETKDFSGALYGGGLGYNWDKVNLMLEVYVRSTGDYDTAFGTSMSAVSSALNISYRF